MSVLLPLFERIKELAKQNKKSLAQVEEEAQFPRGTIKNTKKHAASIETAARLADYFGVSIDTLLGRSSGDYLAEDERQLLALFRSMNAEGKTFVMQLVETASERYKKTTAPSGEVIA